MKAGSPAIWASTMPMSGDEIKSRIQAVFPDATVELLDLAGDNDHWQVTVTSSSFNGKSRVEQHKLVMNAIGEGMGTTLHALSVKTRIPS